LFATHLHKLHEIDIICEAKNLRHFYIDLQFSEGKIVFGRKIFEGIGEKLYGIEVAEYIIDNEEFQRLATKTRRQLLDEPRSDQGVPKSSTYNSATYVDECAICGAKGGQLDVHHIHSQKYADCNDTIEYFNKNHGGNLVVLCVDHHNRVHKGEITVHGWIETSHGKKLSWENSKGNKVHIQGERPGNRTALERTLQQYLDGPHPQWQPYSESLVLQNHQNADARLRTAT
jgi:hypothetical protein